jgi:hypothetical protein
MVKMWHLVAASAICLAVGVLGTLAVVAVTDDDDGPYSQTDPGAARWQCHDAEVLATAVSNDSNVTVHVTIRDHNRRKWQVRVPAYSGTTLLAPDEGGDYRSAAASAGDLDDGPERRVAARPVGQKAWCRGKVSLT